MRVLSLLWGFSLGGIGKCALTYARLGEISDISIETACIYGVNWDCDLQPLKDMGATFIPIQGRMDLSWIRRSSELIERVAPDVVFVHGFNGPIVARILQRKIKRNFPFVCSYHGFYHPPSLSRIPLAPVFNKGVEYVYRRHATAVVAVAQYCKDRLVFRGVPEEKITVVHNGLSERQPRGKLLTHADAGLDDNDFVIGIASRLDPVKGVEYLVDAFAKVVTLFPQARLLLVGNGTCENSLKEQSVKLGIDDKVRFVGYQDNVDAWLDLFDVFVLPSLAENHSIGLLEAMRAGKPIVSTNVGGNPESVEHEKQGLLVPPADAAALEKAILRMIENSELRMQLGSSARKRFKEEFTEDRMLEKIAAWLKRF